MSENHLNSLWHFTVSSLKTNLIQWSAIYGFYHELTHMQGTENHPFYQQLWLPQLLQFSSFCSYLFSGRGSTFLSHFETVWSVGA